MTAENFLEGRTDIDEFLTSFMEKRTVKSPKCTICEKTVMQCFYQALYDYFNFTALPQQKGERGKVATVHQHTGTVSYQPLKAEVQHNLHEKLLYPDSPFPYRRKHEFEQPDGLCDFVCI